MMDAQMGFDPLRALKFAGLAALGLFLCWQQVQATRLGYQVELSRRRAHELRGRLEDMRLQLEQGLSPAALASRAGSRLGMVPASPDSVRALPARAERNFGLRLWARALSPLSLRS